MAANQLPLEFEAETIELPEEVRGFCQRRGILRLLHAAIRLARECFGTKTVKFKMEQDPESGERWVVLMLTIPTESVRAKYRKYMKQWAELAQGPERFLIRISYDLL